MVSRPQRGHHPQPLLPVVARGRVYRRTDGRGIFRSGCRARTAGRRTPLPLGRARRRAGLGLGRLPTELLHGSGRGGGDGRPRALPVELWVVFAVEATRRDKVDLLGRVALVEDSLPGAQMDRVHLGNHALVTAVVGGGGALARRQGGRHHRRKQLRLAFACGLLQTLTRALPALDRGGEVPILGDDQPQLILRHRCQLHIRHARHGRVVYLREDGVVPQVVARLEPLDSDGPSVRLGQAHLEAAAVDDVKRLGRLSLLVHHLALGERPALRQRDRHGLEHLHQPRSLPLFGALAHRGGEGGGSIRPRNLVEDALVYGEHFHGSLGEDRGGAHLASLQKTGLAEEVARPEGGDLALAAVGAGHPHLARPAGDNIESVDGVALPKDVVAAAKRPREGGGHRLAVAVEGDGGAGLGARLAPQARCAAASLGGLVAAPTAAGGLRVAASATGRASACGARAGRGRRVLVALHDCGWDAPRAPELLRLGRGSQHSHHLLDVPLSHLVPHVHAHPPQVVCVDVPLSVAVEQPPPLAHDVIVVRHVCGHPLSVGGGQLMHQQTHQQRAVKGVAGLYEGAEPLLRGWHGLAGHVPPEHPRVRHQIRCGQTLGGIRLQQGRHQLLGLIRHARPLRRVEPHVVRPHVG
mmetsp:Transcript_8167/g.26297  ORF Transcript_8167/g.26297 Transcript_8167/m.26297 type:complete len:639 (-) Transcript_8167:1072-2988(-)